MDLDAWMRRRSAARLACVSAAELRGLALLEPPAQPHIWLPQRYGGRVPDARVHRSRPHSPSPPGGAESVPDMLAHVAACLPTLEALIVFESALDKGLITLSAMRRIRWRSPAARRIAAAASDRSESILETILMHRLAAAGILGTQQARVLGHRVDLLVAGRLVLQADGFEHHRAADRRRDLEHDARLQLAGFMVLRFDYVQLVYGWPSVLETVRTALAQLV